ncbi:hypothetical protein CEXT_41781 [Caerostris extrusa]|uniref:Uncharacterized protein n=1 Tax=Caerostris extrusa TaxID=172846 RepID=A0AAV4XHR5_CAEEX|nr:hypothetical protein CEXT_41781 [Caerostris extrusa]
MPRSERKQNSLRHSPITIYWFSRLSWRLINAAQTDIQDSDKKKKVAKQKPSMCRASCLARCVVVSNEPIRCDLWTNPRGLTVKAKPFTFQAYD